MSKLSQAFYRNPDVQAVARELLGKSLCTNLDGELTKIIITETEAYAGVHDKASHAYGGRRTKRTEPMFLDGGIAYVYLCYGIHHLFNVVTNTAGTPHAVLIRAGVPLEGLEVMLQRRKRTVADKTLLGGPGTIAQAAAITTAMTGEALHGTKIWIEDVGISVAADDISAGPRIGVDYAGDDAQLPYRFWVPAQRLDV